MKVANIFEKSHNFKGWEKMQKWIEDDDICANDLMAIVCAKFGYVTAHSQTDEIETELMVAGNLYKIRIEKVGVNVQS